MSKNNDQIKNVRRMIYFLAVSAFNFSLACSALASVLDTQAPVWEINDVTYILPLPNPRIVEVSLKATELAGNGRPLLPKSFLLGQENIAVGDLIARSPNFNTYDNLFAVGVRIDPCFRDQFKDACRRQIRITWQPVDHWSLNDSISEPITVDASLHTFYDLNESEFRSLLGQLQNLKQKCGIDTRNLPLGVHPGFSKTEATPFQTEFKKIILTYADSAHIRRVAHINLASFSEGWDLLSDDFDAAQNHSPVPIFNSSHVAQQVSNDGGLDLSIMSPSSFDSSSMLKMKNYLSTVDIHSSEHSVLHFLGVDDQSVKSDQLYQFLRGAATPGSSASKVADAMIYLSRAKRIEDPSLHLPGTMDCLSCHTANMTKLFTAKTLGISPPAPSFSKRMNLKNNSRYYGDTHNLRMLGYVNSDVQLGDRVIYESASVAEYLSKSQKEE